jgi:hypothetical protein
VEANNDFTLADPRANQVLQKVRAELGVTTAFRYLGRPVSIPFALANTQTEVLHNLGEIPDGYHRAERRRERQTHAGQAVVEDARLSPEPTWRTATAIIVFGVFREGVQSVSAT